MDKQQGNNRWKIGVLFVIGLLLLLGLTFGTQRVAFFSSTTDLTVYFPSIQGIQEGNRVRVMGVEKGIVKSADIVHPDQVPGDRKGYRVKVDLQLDGTREDLRETLSGRFRFLIRSSSVLGGSEISIERVPSNRTGGQPINFDGPNFGSAEAGGLQALSDWFSKNKNALTETVQSIQSASKSIKKIAARVEQGQGTIGKLIGNDELYKKIEKIADNTEKITSQIKDGDGVLGRLVNDEEMGQDLKNTLSELEKASKSFREMSEKINSGEGTLGKLLQDEEMASNLESTLSEVEKASKNIREISEKMNSGKGTLGRLVNEEDFADNLDTILKNLKEASKDIRDTTNKISEGEGSLGKFVNDDEFYEEAKTTVEGLSEMTGSARRMKTFVGLNTRYFPETEHSIHQAYLRVHPRENKFIRVGASGFDLDYPETDLTFEEGVEDQDDQFLTVTDVQLGSKFYDGHLTLRGGLIEGKFGGGVDYETYVPLLDRTVKFTVEGRTAYDDVGDEDLDEDINGGVMWRSGITTSFLKYGRLYGGVSRIGSEPEAYVGVGFEYEDQDIRNFFSLLGLAN